MAGLRALLAMVSFVLGAFITAGLANVRADSAEGLRVLTAACHRTGRKLADGGAVHVESDAARHHLDVGFLQTGRRAMMASHCTIKTGLDAGFVLLMSH